MIIDTHSQGTILFSNKDNGRSIWAVAFPDYLKASSFRICCFTSSYWVGGILRKGRLTGTSSTVGIRCFTLSV